MTPNISCSRRQETHADGLNARSRYPMRPLPGQVTHLNHMARFTKGMQLYFARRRRVSIACILQHIVE